MTHARVEVRHQNHEKPAASRRLVSRRTESNSLLSSLLLDVDVDVKASSEHAVSVK